MLRAVKAAAPSLGVIYRLSVDDFFDGGLTYGEGRVIAIWAAQAGADALHVTAGHYRSKPTAHRMIPPMAEPDAPFLEFAADVKRAIKVPVIAVGRLGDPAIATAAVASGKADFIALGRTLIADPQWVEKLARDEPIRRCLACNTCIDGMRGGAGISCVVNGAAGRETDVRKPAPPRGERIAVIGAGPAGLTYASLVADGNVGDRVREGRAPRRRVPLRGLGADVPGGRGATRRALRATSTTWRRPAGGGVTFQFDTDVARTPAVLAPFNRIVVATGASYPLGIWPLAKVLLERGAGRWPAMSALFSNASLRDWFYYRARQPTGARLHAAGADRPVRHRDRRRGQARQEQGSDRQRIRGGAAGRRPGQEPGTC